MSNRSTSFEQFMWLHFLYGHIVRVNSAFRNAHDVGIVHAVHVFYKRCVIASSALSTLSARCLYVRRPHFWGQWFSYSWSRSSGMQRFMTSLISPTPTRLRRIPPTQRYSRYCIVVYPIPLVCPTRLSCFESPVSPPSIVLHNRFSFIAFLRLSNLSCLSYLSHLPSFYAFCSVCVGRYNFDAIVVSEFPAVSTLQSFLPIRAFNIVQLVCLVSSKLTALYSVFKFS